MADQLSPDELEHARELFVFFDKDGDGRIHAEEVIKLIRSLGLNPVEADVNALMEEELKHQATREPQRRSSAKRGPKAQHGSRHDGSVDLPQVLQILERVPRRQDCFGDLMAAFLRFDKYKTGKLSVKELKEILVTKGEGMTSEEAEELIEFAQPTYKGEIYYVSLIGRLQDMSPQF